MSEFKDRMVPEFRALAVTMQQALPDTEVAAKAVKPLDLDSPLFQPQPTFEERLRKDPLTDADLDTLASLGF